MLPIIVLMAFQSCSDEENEDFIDAPSGQYRVTEQVFYCGPPEDGSSEYWIFDQDSKSMTARVIDSVGQELSNVRLVYRPKGENLIIGEGREFSYETVSGFLELTYLDSPDLADDELLIRLASF